MQYIARTRLSQHVWRTLTRPFANSQAKKKYITLGELIKNGGTDVSEAKELPVDETSFLNPPGYAEKFVYDIPYDTKGSGKIHKFLPKSLIQKIIFAQPPEDIEFSSIFHSFYDSFIDSLVKADHEKLRKLCEGRLATRCIQALDSLHSKNLQLSIEVQNGSRTCNADVVDYYLNRGLNVDRSKNGLNADYVMNTDLEEFGLRYYMHRGTFPEYQNTYFYALDANGKLLRKPSEFHEYRHMMVKNDMQFIMKLVAQVTDTNRLQVLDGSNNNRGLINYDPNYTGIHTLVFENLLTPPKMTAGIDLNLFDWISAHRARKENWVLVDIDNYLNGNSYFPGMTSHQEFLKNLRPKTIPAGAKISEKKLTEILKPLVEENKKDRIIYKDKHDKTIEEISEMVKTLEEDSAQARRQEELDTLPVEELLKLPDPEKKKKFSTKVLAKPLLKLSKKQKAKAKAKAAAKEQDSLSKKKWKSR